MTVRSLLGFVVWISAMKSSTYTSSVVRNLVVVWLWPLVGICIQLMSIMMSSIGWGLGLWLVLMAVAAMSLAVSVVAQKNGGLSLQPICRALGMMSYGLSPGLLGGRTYAKLCASAAFTIMRQYPSFRSTLEKRNGMPVSGARASVCMIRGITFLSSYIECCGASVLLDTALTIGSKSCE